ncbi:hypothetical protein KM043_017871 [Ampulex compressa]|nr:hypothetical protein KM043_017871 [Ampulex compressa]
MENVTINTGMQADVQNATELIGRHIGIERPPFGMPGKLSSSALANSGEREKEIRASTSYEPRSTVDPPWFQGASKPTRRRTSPAKLTARDMRDRERKAERETKPQNSCSVRIILERI